jgi:hypothetical protein
VILVSEKIKRAQSNGKLGRITDVLDLIPWVDTTFNVNTPRVAKKGSKWCDSLYRRVRASDASNMDEASLSSSSPIEIRFKDLLEEAGERIMSGT